MDLSAKIIDWYKKNKRDLPWRHTTDPYQIWVSEVILQQTRVNQGIAYYFRFLESFPTIQHLAKAHEDAVLKIWEGLGYYSRARNMHEAAKYICKVYRGKLPNTYKELLHIKGIGPYTAAAIASFCYNEHVAVCDGNVMRVISRFLGIDIPVDTTIGKKALQDAAYLLLPKKTANLYNQAIMEFGALHCTPAQPLCHSCVLQNTCSAFAQNRVSELPVKQPKRALRNRYFYYLLLDNGKSFFIKQRTDNDIWQQLYELPVFVSDKPIKIKNFLPDFFTPLINTKTDLAEEISDTYTHILSHQKLHIQFFHVRYVKKRIYAPPLKNITYNKASKLAFPIIIKKYLHKKGIFSDSSFKPTS